MSQAILTRPGVGRPPLSILVAIAAVSPLAINLFVPSIPRIAEDLSASYATIQLGLSLYLAFMAVIQLVSGPVSDRLGRRPVLLFGLSVFVIGSVMCALAPNAEMFLAGRVVQTTSAVGLMLARTIVRDVYPREKSASMIGYVIMAMAVAPMLAPAIGGLIDELAGWRMVFAMMAAYGILALVMVWIGLPETNTSRGMTTRQQIDTWRLMASLPSFWFLTGATSLSTMVFFAFLGGAPAVSSIHLGQTPLQYGLWFAICPLGYAIGNFLSGRYAERRGVQAMMRDGAIITLICPFISFALFALGFDHPASMFLPLLFVGVGNGVALPNFTAAAISLRPEAAGAASGLLGALQVGGGAVGAATGAIVVGAQGSPIALALLMSGFGIAAMIATAIAIRALNAFELRAPQH